MRALVMFSAIALTVTLAPLPAAHPQPAPERRAATFVAMPCPGFFPAKRQVDCGFVRVPEDRTKPHGRMIKVAAAVIRAKTEQPAAAPIVFLDGGPSFGAIAPFALSAYFSGWAVARDRDIILVDTRGTGISEPRLGCPELDQAEVRAFYAPPTVNSQALPIYRRALTACWRRLVREGIDPRAYTSAESAADLEALRRALRVSEWDVFAVSADGVLGATYARLFPDHIRSLVFDSSMSPQAKWGPDFDRGLYRLLNKIFRGCRANDACRAAYPHIKRRFNRQVRRLRADPVVVRFPDFKPHSVALEVDGIEFFVATLNEIYPGDLFGTPSLLLNPLDHIWRTSHGEVRDIYRGWFGNGPVTSSHVDDSLAQGKTLSYACHDLVPSLTPRALRRAARDLPALAPRYLSSDFDLDHAFITYVSPAGCRYWPVGQAPASQRQPLQTDIPALVLAGEYDTAMVPYVVRKLRRGLTHHYFFKMPASGHLQLAAFTNGHACARKIARAFLADPTTAPDSSCLASVPPADFTPTPPGRHAKWSPWRPVRMTYASPASP